VNLLRTVPAEAPPLRPGLLDSGRKGVIPPISPCTASAPFDDVRFVVVIVTSIPPRPRSRRGPAVATVSGGRRRPARPRSRLRGGSSAEPADGTPRRLAVVLTEDRRV